jgi:hypothetical protein
MIKNILINWTASNFKTLHFKKLLDQGWDRGLTREGCGQFGEQADLFYMLIIVVEFTELHLKEDKC